MAPLLQWIVFLFPPLLMARMTLPHPLLEPFFSLVAYVVSFFFPVILSRMASLAIFFIWTSLNFFLFTDFYASQPGLYSGSVGAKASLLFAWGKFSLPNPSHCPTLFPFRRRDPRKPRAITASKSSSPLRPFFFKIQRPVKPATYTAFPPPRASKWSVARSKSEVPSSAQLV